MNLIRNEVGSRVGSPQSPPSETKEKSRKPTRRARPLSAFGSASSCTIAHAPEGLVSVPVSVRDRKGLKMAERGSDGFAH